MRVGNITKTLNIKLAGVLLSLLIFLSGAALAATPHTSLGLVNGGDTSTPWKFYVVSRPTEVLTDNLIGIGPYGFVASVDNLPHDWAVGEDSVAIIWKENNPGALNHIGYYAVINENLTLAAPQYYADCTLRAIPTPTATADAFGGKVDLSWSLPPQDQYENPANENSPTNMGAGTGNTPANNIIGYNIYRSTNGITFLTKINDALVAGTTYSDTAANSTPDPVNNTLYYYAIEIVYKGGVVAGPGTPILSANSNSVTYPAAAPRPTITRTPTSFTLSVTEGQIAASQPFTVGNSGNATLNYTITDNQDWLSETPTSGAITQGGADQPITIHFDTASLAPGPHNATITVTDESASNNPQTISVALTVIPLPRAVLSVDPTSFNLSTTEGQNAANRNFTIYNTGNASLHYTITKDQSWLSVNKTSGTIASGESDPVNIVFNTAALSADLKIAHITITDPDASGSPKIVTVNLSITSAPLPVAQVIPSKLTPFAGETIDITLKYSESNQITTSWTAPNTAGWCDLTPYFSGVQIHGTTSINVVPATLHHIVISPESVTLKQGQSAIFTAKGYDVYGNERTGDIISFASALGNSATVTANVAAGHYTISASKDGKSDAANITVTSKYDSLIVRVESGKVNVSAKDALGSEVALPANASVAYDITGKTDGNAVASDGTIVEGSKEGDFTVTATVTIGSQTLTGTGTVNVNKGGPAIQAKIDNQDLANNIAISSKPNIEINLTDGNGIKAVRIFIDGSEMTGFSLRAQNTASSSVSYTPDTSLGSGSHTVLIEAEDNLGTKSSISAQGLKVYNDLQLQGKPMNYPNPFKPSAGSTTINYRLTKDSEVKLMIYDFTGRLVYTQVFASASNGGRIGENEPTWDGKSFTGVFAGNGVYVYFITAGGKVIGSGEISVYE